MMREEGKRGREKDNERRECRGGRGKRTGDAKCIDQVLSQAEGDGLRDRQLLPKEEEHGEVDVHDPPALRVAQQVLAVSIPKAGADGQERG